MEIKIKENEEYIKLGQALKASGAASSGTEAKLFITEGNVSVNGETEKRRGRKCYPGDIILCMDEEIKVVV